MLYNSVSKLSGSIKGQLISKGLFVFFNSPKKRMKNFCPSRQGQKMTFSSSFLGELKTIKFPFEINWPLVSHFIFEKMIGTILINDVAHHFLHNQNSLLYFHLSVSWQSLGQRNYLFLPNGYFGSSSWLPKRPFRDLVNDTTSHQFVNAKDVLLLIC